MFCRFSRCRKIELRLQKKVCRLCKSELHCNTLFYDLKMCLLVALHRLFCIFGHFGTQFGYHEPVLLALAVEYIAFQTPHRLLIRCFIADYSNRLILG